MGGAAAALMSDDELRNLRRTEVQVGFMKT